MGDGRFYRIAIIAVLALLAASVAQPYVTRLLLSDTAPRAVTPRGDLSDAEQSITALFERASPSVVQVVGRQSGWIHMLVAIGLFGLLASFHGIILACSRQIFALARAGYLPAADANEAYRMIRAGLSSRIIWHTTWTWIEEHAKRKGETLHDAITATLAKVSARPGPSNVAGDLAGDFMRRDPQDESS